MKDWQTLRDKLLQDPEVRAEYDKLEPEYQIARQLIKARLAKKLTQAELAAKAGVKQAYIARLEGGDANPTVESLNKVASALGLRLQLT
jgi:ribosome-binding protein aMBF1 (putative translation factor)